LPGAAAHRDRAGPAQRVTRGAAAQQTESGRNRLDAGARFARQRRDGCSFRREVEDDGTARLRFGDDRLGARPEALSAFDAKYRIGNGAAGNVGAEAIAHLFTNDAALLGRPGWVRNPLPADGGIEPESMTKVRAYAPAAFRTQERAVTEADYAAVTERHPGVQRAIATFSLDRQLAHRIHHRRPFGRIGGWTTIFEASIRRHVERYRIAGHDLEIDGPRYVSLEIDMTRVGAEPEYFRADVKGSCSSSFSNRVLADGVSGFFIQTNSPSVRLST